MSEFLEEVKEDLRHDQLVKLWQRYKSLIIGGIIGFFAVTAGIIYFQNTQDARNHRQAEALAEAVALGQAGRLNDAIEILEKLGAESGKVYPMVARFRLASTLVTRHFSNPSSSQTVDTLSADLDKAIAILESIEQSNADDAYKALATLARTYLVLPKVGTPEALEALKPLQTQKNPWHELAREVEIMLKMRDGDTTSAHLLATELAGDMNAPMALRLRAQSFAAVTQVPSAPARGSDKLLEAQQDSTTAKIAAPATSTPQGTQQP